MAENTRRMNNEPVFGSLAYDLNTLNWGSSTAMPPANPRNSPRSLCAVRSAGSVPGRSPAAVRQPVPGSMPPRLCWPVWPCC